jgi:hypothetical protein
MPLRPGLKAWIAHEGGPGKDNAGIGGLALAQRFVIPLRPTQRLRHVFPTVEAC